MKNHEERRTRVKMQTTSNEYTQPHVAVGTRIGTCKPRRSAGTLNYGSNILAYSSRTTSTFIRNVLVECELGQVTQHTLEYLAHLLRKRDLASLYRKPAITLVSGLTFTKQARGTRHIRFTISYSIPKIPISHFHKFLSSSVRPPRLYEYTYVRVIFASNSDAISRL